MLKDLRQQPLDTPAIWQLGFRPFFLLGPLMGCIALSFWLFFLSGGVTQSLATTPILWHAHEMIYGFSTAIVAGFILTASQNWSGKRGVHGHPLIVLVLVWAIARVLMFFPASYAPVIGVVDLMFYPLLGYFLFTYLKDPELKEERIFYLFFAMLWVGNFLIHFGQSQALLNRYHIFDLAGRGVLLGLHTMVLIVLFLGGRVIPFFTESNASKKQPKENERLEKVLPWLGIAFVLVHLVRPGSIYSAVISAMMAAAHAWRWWGWQVRRSYHVHLLWILHIGYLWLVLGFLAYVFVDLGFLQRSIAVHSLGVGGISMIILGMIARVSLGHTGRPLRPRPVTVVAFYLIAAAAVVRVLGALIFTHSVGAIWWTSGLLWITAFLLYFSQYWKLLSSPRIDGRRG
jgi:uncharacterized protein involved in response to NO